MIVWSYARQLLRTPEQFAHWPAGLAVYARDPVWLCLPEGLEEVAFMASSFTPDLEGREALDAALSRIAQHVASGRLTYADIRAYAAGTSGALHGLLVALEAA